MADEGAYEQAIIRKKLFSSKYKGKKVKVFLVTNYIEDDLRELLEEEGVEVVGPD